MTLGVYQGAGSGITKGLWHFEGNSNDSSGNTNNGTDTNITYGLEYGRFGQGARLERSPGSSISFGDPATLRFSTGDFTHSWWQYAVSNPSVRNDSLFNKDPDGSKFYSQIVVTTNVVQIGNLLTSTVTSCATAITTGVWENYIVTRSAAGVLNVYLNSRKDATASGTATDISAAGTALTFGKGNDYYPDLYVDEVIMENVVWSQATVSKYYTWAKGRFGLE